MASDITIQSKEAVFETNTETYLPKINITLLRETLLRKTLTNNNDTLENVLLQHRAELIELKIRKNR